ncbi:alpha,alpha-trehalase TreF [Ameyamaea chiangmaiensis]|nr:alpha,alpha-trehalase TreF [Ameyamaea chiangmaiensis]MBS4076378.1 alpha,alpha-trehalase TreF [Ameyamaea chiangmaiensis]
MPPAALAATQAQAEITTHTVTATGAGSGAGASPAASSAVPPAARLLVPVTPSIGLGTAAQAPGTPPRTTALPVAPLPPIGAPAPSVAAEPPSAQGAGAGPGAGGAPQPAAAPGLSPAASAPAAPSPVASAPTGDTPQTIPDALVGAIGAAHVFPDAKTAVDAIPDAPADEIGREFEEARSRPGFNLHDFVMQHFAIAPTKSLSYRRRPDESVMEYIDGMWDVLTRKADISQAHSSLLPLPHDYVVPGGRFSELYYWDSYFTMIGLFESQRIDLMRDMVRDMASLIDRYGHIPNGARAYYLSRSEPPAFALMVDLLAQHDGQVAYATYLPQLRREYDYWMQGADALQPGQQNAHVVRLPDGALMNRYWDARDTPRDESYPQDVATAALTDRPHNELWRDLRAGSESGWDFSSRWLADGRTLATIHTTELLPVDLNALMAHLEQALAYGYAVQGDATTGQQFSARANARIAAMNQYLWSADRKGYFDYDWKAGKQTDIVSGAMAMPLFLRLASPDQARLVAQTVQDKLLKHGGLTATDRTTGQQWDAPNGWAPLEWIAIKGLLQYHQDKLAADIAYRWMSRVIGTYEKSGVLLEKYDVVATDISPQGGKGGGEYPMQIGFGWTNGTLIGLMNRFPQTTRLVLDHNPLAEQQSTESTSQNGEDLPSFVDYSQVPVHKAAPSSVAPSPRPARPASAGDGRQAATTPAAAEVPAPANDTAPPTVVPNREPGDATQARTPGREPARTAEQR